MNSMQLPTHSRTAFHDSGLPLRDALLRPQRLKRLQQIEPAAAMVQQVGVGLTQAHLDDTQFFLPYLRTLHFLETALCP